MTKLFYVTGDSYAFGEELDGPREPGNLYYFSDFQRKHCYSGIMSDKLGYLNYKNTALPGGSNQRAYRKLVENVSEALTVYNPSEIFVNVSITHCSRREFFNSERNKYYVHMLTHEPPKYTDEHKLWELMVKNFSSDKSEHEFDQLMILGIQNFLRQNKIPYLLTYSFHYRTIFNDQLKHVPTHILNQRLTPRFIVDDSFSMFTDRNKFPRGPQHHPLIEGHTAWAESLLNYISNNNLLSNVDL